MIAGVFIPVTRHISPFTLLIMISDRFFSLHTKRYFSKTVRFILRFDVLYVFINKHSHSKFYEYSRLITSKN